MAGARIVMQVKGVHCQSCVRRVAESLLGVEGVDDVEVELERGAAVITLNEHDPADRAHLAAAVDDAGFSVAGFAD